MKKLIVFAVLVAFGQTMGSAQDVQFGAKAGLNFATLQPELTDSRTAFHLGAMAEISLTDVFSVQPELLYSGHGAKDQNDSDNNEIFKVDYLALPILAKYYVVDGLSVEAGPQLGFLLSSKQEDNGETDDLKDITKSTDFGFALGVGYKLDSGLNFGVRYYLGSDVNDIDTDSEEFKNRVLQLSIGYFF
ncbi:porin family protein [Allomuricauda sp. d1]|uniref:porin family protein n=1 Tax=Allomuricauda sp. d1 TaxID=3136725 RepID=UPI0031D42F51